MSKRRLHPAGVGKMTARPASASSPRARAPPTSSPASPPHLEGMPVVGFAGTVPRANFEADPPEPRFVSLFRPSPAIRRKSRPRRRRSPRSSPTPSAPPNPAAAAPLIVSLPTDVMNGPATDLVLTPATVPLYGPGPRSRRRRGRPHRQAQLPVLVLGMDASRPANAAAVRALLAAHPIPTVCTYQGAGVVPPHAARLLRGPHRPVPQPAVRRAARRRRPRHHRRLTTRSSTTRICGMPARPGRSSTSTTCSRRSTAIIAPRSSSRAISPRPSPPSRPPCRPQLRRDTIRRCAMPARSSKRSAPRGTGHNGAPVHPCASSPTCRRSSPTT